MKILFVTGYGPIVQNKEESHKFYIEALGLTFEGFEGDYLYTSKLKGVAHFALWPLSEASQSCFGNPVWPKDISIPQGWIEFDVDDLETATKELEDLGYKLLVRARKEPWGQVVTRLLSPEGLLAGIVYTPSMRDKEKK